MSTQVEQVLKLTVKGQTIELTREEAMELHGALSGALGIATPSDENERLRDLIRVLNERDRHPIPQLVPVPYPVNPFPAPPQLPPWAPKPPYEIWCGSNSNASLEPQQ